MEATISSGSWHGYYEENAQRVPFDVEVSVEGDRVEGSGAEGERTNDRAAFRWTGRYDRATHTLTVQKAYGAEPATVSYACSRGDDGCFAGTWKVRKATGSVWIAPRPRTWLAERAGTKLFKHLEGVVEVTDFGVFAAPSYRALGVRERPAEATHYVVKTSRVDGSFVAFGTATLRPLVDRATAEAMAATLRADEAPDGPDGYDVTDDPRANAATLRRLWARTKAPPRDENPAGVLHEMVLGELSAVLGIARAELDAERDRRFPQVRVWMAPPRPRRSKALPLP